MNTIIVLPTYNEAENLEQLIKEILELHPAFGIIVVDDNSPDGTGEIADAISARDSRVSVVHRPGKLGLGTAYVRGFQEALAKGADLIFEMDADFSHDVKYLKDFVDAADNADLIIGSRYVNGVRVEGWRFRRLLLSKLANMYVSYVLVKPIWDFTAGFRCYRRKLLESIDFSKIKSDGYAFQIEMTYLAFKHGFTVLEIPITFRERKRGATKISRGVVWEALWLTLRCRAPLMQILRHGSFLFKDYRHFVEMNQSGSGKDA
ncbi:MAG TPA: polyprenol monophosphomannose synthase [Syntrophorhabdaceae bacterium]|nr:polyprenol monophosphomannose synthase [Syntrophorhabdaceae bacterium]